MIDIKNKADCCGCRACEAVCPVQCITMELDSELFYYPKVNLSKCINCGKCEKVCPIINIPTNNRIDQEVYAVWSKDKNIRHDASSGGMFETLARTFFENQGVVFGAAFDEKLQLKHRYATNITELKSLCKSKYLHSSMNQCYKNVKEFLDDGKEVLFVGTPCQTAAIRNYLGKSYDKLTLVDLVCHGVPSQELFNECVRYEEEQRGIRLRKYEFRTKTENGATPHYYTEGFVKNGKYKERVGIYYKSPFYLGFQKYITLRPSCYECRFSNPDRVSDITIADFHDIEKYIKNADRMKGVSMIIVNTLKGKVLFDNVKNNLETVQFDLQTAIENNACLEKATPMPAEREKFFNDLRTREFEFIVNNYLTTNKYWVLDLYYSLPKSIRSIAKKIMLKE